MYMYIYIYIIIYNTTRNAVVLVYTVYRGSCKMSIINITALQGAYLSLESY